MDSETQRFENFYPGDDNDGLGRDLSPLEDRSTTTRNFDDGIQQGQEDTLRSKEVRPTLTPTSALTGETVFYKRLLPAGVPSRRDR